MNRREKKGGTILRWHLGFGKEKICKPGMVGVYETPLDIAVVYGVWEGSKPIIKDYVFEAADTPTAKQAVINQFVLANTLQGVDCSYVLGPGEYNVNLVESPQVATTEIPMAMRWMLRDLINYPAEEAIIDTFEVPFLRARDNVKMIYAVTLRKQLIESIETLVKPSGLILKFVDIPEMTLKNILNQHAKKLKGCALVYLNTKGGKLILCRDDQICITRSFDLKLDNLGQDASQDIKTLESLALEFQRSFDYLNSVFRQNIQNMIVLAPTPLNKDVLEGSLKANLGADIIELKLSEVFNFEKIMQPDEEAKCLFAVGAVLRREEKAT